MPTVKASPYASLISCQTALNKLIPLTIVNLFIKYLADLRYYIEFYISVLKFIDASRRNIENRITSLTCVDALCKKAFRLQN